MNLLLFLLLDRLGCQDSAEYFCSFAKICKYYSTFEDGFIIFSRAKKYKIRVFGISETFLFCSILQTKVPN